MKKLILDYKKMLNKRYVKIYLLYFGFFIANEPLEQLMALFLAEKGLSAQHYSYVLSAFNACCIVVPGVIGFLAVRYSAYAIADIGLLIGVVVPVILAKTGRADFLTLLAVILLLVRTVFNNSIGNDINYEIDDNDRGKYFAVRDLFLYGGCSAGLFIGGIITRKESVEALYGGWGLLYLIPLIMLFVIRKGSIREKRKKETCDKEKISARDYAELLKDKKVLAYMGVNLFTSIYGIAISYLPLYAVTIGLTVSNVLSMNAAVLMFNALMALVVSHWGDLKGRKGFSVFDIAFDCIPALLFMVSKNIYVFAFAIILTMIKDMFAAVSFAYFYDIFPDERGTALLGLIASIDSIVGILMPILIGYIWKISPQLVFGLAALGCIIAALIAVLFLPNVSRNGGD